MALVAGLLILPAVLIPNPQDAAIARQQQLREEAETQAREIEEVAKDLESTGGDAQDSADPAGP